MRGWREAPALSVRASLLNTLSYPTRSQEFKGCESTGSVTSISWRNRHRGMRPSPQGDEEAVRWWYEEWWVAVKRKAAGEWRAFV